MKPKPWDDAVIRIQIGIAGLALVIGIALSVASFLD